MHVFIKEPIGKVFFGFPGILLSFMLEQGPLHQHLELPVGLAGIDGSQWYIHLQHLHRFAAHLHCCILVLGEFFTELVGLELFGHRIFEFVDDVPLLLEVHQSLLRFFGLRVVASVRVPQSQLGALVFAILI